MASVLVGNPARDMLLTNPERAVYSAKRLMGRGSEDVQEELELFPFRIAEGQRIRHSAAAGDSVFTPPQIAR